MPKVDGYEVLRALRDGTCKRPDRVIVMTRTYPARRARRNSCTRCRDVFMPKPFSLEELESILSNSPG